MQEIWIPEVLITLFLLLSLIQKGIRKLWTFKGLVWLPLPAFLIALSLFPAYGFRPEAAPLLILSLIILLFRLPVIISSVGKGSNEEYNEGKRFLIFPAIMLLAASLAAAIVFSPIEIQAENTEKSAFSARDSLGRDYFIRVFPAPGETPGIFGPKSPLLVLSPPLYGSAGAVEGLCGELQKR
jgi:hypothetical protein